MFKRTDSVLALSEFSIKVNTFGDYYFSPSISKVKWTKGLPGAFDRSSVEPDSQEDTFQEVQLE